MRHGHLRIESFSKFNVLFELSRLQSWVLPAMLMKVTASETRDEREIEKPPSVAGACAGAHPAGASPTAGAAYRRHPTRCVEVSSPGHHLPVTGLRHVQAFRSPVAKGVTMTWRVFAPDSNRLIQLGYPALSGCHVLFHDERGYGRDPNRFLRDRYRGRWEPHYKDGPSGARNDPKRPTSSKGEADRLAHFLNWAEAHVLDIDRMNYEDVLGYQDNMTPLRPSLRRPTVGPATRNQRADVATLYLMWRADRGLRSGFDVTTKLVRAPSRGRKEAVLVYARSGRQRHSGDQLPTLSLPSKAQKLAWYTAVRRRLGVAKMLASRCMNEIGVRAFENVALRVEQWPSRDEILAAQRSRRQDVPMRILNGKGGKERVAGVPLHFALMVREWIDEHRCHLVRPSLRDKGPLFVSDRRGFEGTPLSQATIYKCFKITTPGGPVAWHPHLARHDYACNFVLTGLRHDAAISGTTLPGTKPSWVTDRTAFWINMLRKRLGHVSETTTDRYLKWIAESYQLAEVADSYADFLGGGDP